MDYYVEWIVKGGIMIDFELLFEKIGLFIVIFYGDNGVG